MKQEILSANSTYQEKVLAILKEMASSSDAILNRKPADGGWSAIQTIHHLILSEELALRYIQKKLSVDSPLETVGFGHKFRSFLLKSFLKLPFKFQAPPMVSDASLPEYATLVQTEARWLEIRRKWTEYLDTLPPSLENAAVFKHPRAGRLSWIGTVEFFSDHLNRHTNQIRRNAQP